MNQESAEGAAGKLPAEVAAALGPKLRHALDSPVRREILRILNASKRPLAPREIASELSEFTLSEINYHAQVLDRSGVLALDDPDQRVELALRVTEEFDRDHRQNAARHSPKLLTSFRVPRPTISIRLGRGRSGRE